MPQDTTHPPEAPVAGVQRKRLRGLDDVLAAVKGAWLLGCPRIEITRGTDQAGATWVTIYTSDVEADD